MDDSESGTDFYIDLLVGKGAPAGFNPNLTSIKNLIWENGAAPEMFVKLLEYNEVIACRHLFCIWSYHV
ncbi:MAG TPA: hypothetical protein VHQ70_07570 [Syntrophomonadaceae bacterium]|nr:hypothetical protein [Syntrophomonadaceae bacterium]